MSPRRQGLAYAAVVTGAVFYAILAVGNGLDRLADEHPGGTGRVPAIFAFHALTERSRAALLAGNPPEALALAERLVARAPNEPTSTALLGDARLATGDAAGADAAFRVAGQMGWRVPDTQIYLTRKAMDAGDFSSAALHLDALLRQRPELIRDLNVLAPFEDGGPGEAALVGRLAARPPWLDWYTGAIDPVPAPLLAGRVPTLLLLARRGVVLGCDAVAKPEQTLRDAGFQAQAGALHRAHCAIAGPASPPA